MKYLLLFEELKIKKTKKIYKHLDSGKGGTYAILNTIDDFNDMTGSGGGNDDIIGFLGEILKNLVKRFGLKTKVKYINSGSFGMAFGVGSNKVIKLTSEKGEALIAKNMLGKNIPNCVNYYDVVLVKGYGVYAILMDRAEMFDEATEKIVDKMTNMNIAQCTLKEVKRRTNTELNDKKVQKIVDDYVKMYKSLTKSKVSIQDLHTGNMGYLDGKMVHFDMMGDSSYRDISKIKVKK